MRPHTHRLSIADEETIQIYLEKLAKWDAHQARRERLLAALDRAAACCRRPGDTKERKAFLHGLLTGYAVALKLW